MILTEEGISIRQSDVQFSNPLIYFRQISDPKTTSVSDLHPQKP
jgi:hypothetical protein